MTQINIGSSYSNEVIIQSTLVEEFHAILICDKNKISIKNLFEQGVKVNNIDVKEHLLNVDDILEIGGHIIYWEFLLPSFETATRDLILRKLTIGKNKQCQIHIPHPQLNEYHAELIITGSHQFFIKTINNTSKISVNDKLTNKQQLKIGDEVYFGSLLFPWLTYILLDSLSSFVWYSTVSDPCAPEEDWSVGSSSVFQPLFPK